MTPIEGIVVFFISALIGYLLWRDIRKTNSVPRPKLPQEPKHKDRVRTIIICGNCGKPYHVTELTREIEIECRCGKTCEPWKLTP